MPTRLTGRPSLSYMGVNAPQPPNIATYNRAPTPNDWQNFSIGDIWMNTNITPPTLIKVYMLVALIGNQATWITINGGGGGDVGLRSQDTLLEIPDNLGYINVIGGAPYLGDSSYINMNTTQRDANSLYVNLNYSITQPFTTADATMGMYSLGKVNFLYALGTNNTMLGLGSANLGITTASATDNTSIGFGSLHNLTTGAFNTSLGSTSLPNTYSGNYNIGIGANSGVLLAAADSDDILIGHPGKNNESNAIYIGQGGTGTAQQNKFYVPAIWEGFATPGLSTGLCIVNSAGLVYVDTIAPNCVLITDNTGNPVGIQGAAGTVYTGMGTGYPPQFLAFKPDSPTTPTVTTAIDPTTGAIILTAHAGGTAGVTNFTPDTSGPVLPNAGNVILKGGDMINTDGSVAHQVTISLNRGALGAVVAGTGISSAAEYTTLSSHNGSIVFDYSTPYVIDMVATGGTGSGIVNLTADSGLTCNQSTVNIQGGANIVTLGVSNTSPTSQLRVSLIDNISVTSATASAYLTAGTDITTVAGSVLLPFTGNVSGGVIRFGGMRTMHQFGDNVTGSNIFAGYNSGNITLTPNTAIGNSGFGALTLNALTVSSGNTATGYQALQTLAGGSGQNTASGHQCLNQLVSGAYNTAYGWQSATNYNGSESHNVLLRNAGVATTDNHVMRLGTDGVGNGQQNMAFMAGTYAAPRAGQLPFTSPQMMIMDTDGRMGTLPISPSEAGNFITDNGTAVVSATDIQILGGYNINTSGTSNIVTINVDNSIQLGNSDISGEGIYALGTLGGTNYAANRFMHNYGTSSTWLGYQAGPITAPGTVSCVGIGTNALTLAAGAYNNVSIGVNSMSNATTSNNCVCIGTSSGSALTTGSWNVFLGSSGTISTTGSSNISINANPTAATTSNELRIGAGTGTGNGQLTATYVSGIYNQSVSTTNLPVYIDNTGKLGTGAGGSASCSFSYYLNTRIGPASVSSGPYPTTGGVTGAGEIYLLGTNGVLSGIQGALTAEYDTTGGAMYPGDGNNTKAIFTAPMTGYYLFTMCATFTNVPNGTSPLYIYSDSGNYKFVSAPVGNILLGGTTDTSESTSVMIKLTTGQRVWWGASWVTGQNVKYTCVGIDGVVGGFRTTYISGQRMS